MERLAITGLSKFFGQLHVTRDVGFGIQSGERVALIGPNGAGKTTLVNLVSGALSPSAGVIRFEGREIQRTSLAQRARLGLIRTYQISRVFHDLTVAENIQVALLHKDGRASGLFFQPPRSVYQERIRASLRQLQIETLAGRTVSTLSLGERRMVELALALAMEPKVLLLDEPAAGIPRGEAHLVLDAVNALPSDLAVVLIEHDMKIVFSWAQRVIVLAGGAVLADGPAQQIANDPAVKRIYFGQGSEAHVH